MSRLTRAVATAMILASAGCASAGGGGARGSADTITAEQLMKTGQRDLYQAVQALRPNWLRARSGARLNGMAPVMLYLNGAPYGTVSDLRSIPVDNVRDVRYMSGSEATTRYGLTGGSVGLVLVRTKG